MSTLPFDPADLMTLRVTQADLSRMWQVSRQAVSQWVAKGIISTYPDGTIDPKRAVKEYLTNTDGSRMRAKFMRLVSNEIDELKQANAGLLTRLQEQHADLQHVLELLGEQSVWLEVFQRSVAAHLDVLATCENDDERQALIDSLFDDAADAASTADPAEALARLDDGIAELCQPIAAAG